MNRWLATHPVKATLVLAFCAAITYASYRIGRSLLEPTRALPEGQRSLVGRYFAWPGGMWVAFAFGTVAMATLLIPDGRIDGKLRFLLARVIWWSTATFAFLQFFDDHLLDQAGTGNPSGIYIPYPIQDLAELPVIGAIVISLLLGIVSLPWRISMARDAGHGEDAER